MTKKSKATRVGLCLAVVTSAYCVSLGEDWPRFRGLNGTGVSTSRGLPAEFGPTKNLLWKIDAANGSSSPIISHGMLFFTSFADEQRTLHCVDAATGKERWTQSVKKVRQENATPPNGPATPTPVTDGTAVFVLYPDVGLLCYTMEGKEKWRKEIEPFHSMHGIASSLMTAGNVVILVADQLSGSYIQAFYADTGKVAWRADRADGLTGGYSTPSVYRPKNGPERLIVSGPLEVVAYDIATGKRLWWISGVTNCPISVPVIWRDRVFVCEELGEPIPFSMFAPFDKNKDGKISIEEVKSNIPVKRLIERIDSGWGNHKGEIGAAEWDKAFGSYVNKGGLVALDLGGSGDVSRTHVRWSRGKSIPTIPSALVYEDLIYVIKDGGIVSTFEADTGKLVKQARLQQGGKQFYVSPVAADGLIYLLDIEGKLMVVKAGRDWKQLRTIDLGEHCFATPAICDGRLYIRTSKSLFCFGA
ncbi:MAG TPA: PQQ-binding-like beta-propeller repeat protein [Planctomycetaceae bacterium]|nr:PQQ-binding-like beta-propeller repeat protein [Planctomycetaceae bacterium]